MTRRREKLLQRPSSFSSSLNPLKASQREGGAAKLENPYGREGFTAKAVWTLHRRVFLRGNLAILWAGDKGTATEGFPLEGQREEEETSECFHGAMGREEEGTSPKENEESIRGEATGKGGI